MIRSTQEIIKEIQNTNAILHQEIESIPYAQRPAVQISMTRAAEKLPVLLDEIKSIVIPYRLVGLFAGGATTAIEEVAALLNKNEGLVLDANKLYNDITNTAEASYGCDREFSTTQYNLIVQGISNIAIDLGYLEIIPPKFVNKMCRTWLDTFNLVKDTIREFGVGDQLNVDLFKKQIIDWIVRCQIEAKQIPVLVTGVSEQAEKNQIATLFCRTIDYTFETTFVVNAKNITALFSKKQVDKTENKE
jgi:hypothetical protein